MAKITTLELFSFSSNFYTLDRSGVMNVLERMGLGDEDEIGSAYGHAIDLTRAKVQRAIPELSDPSEEFDSFMEAQGSGFMKKPRKERGEIIDAKIGKLIKAYDLPQEYEWNDFCGK